ncbi:ankyrin repeat domain-containing protein [Leptospira idonii]|uniref:Peptidase metallopeptidase domain-containing protein n=1 Tax=Leptospira idonii TaxID=1193500 RepID=A0A4R9LTK3_9LEPT|nr:ankyrin repeat domain-containing protein [Leptospira idonii]TGN16921.1 hypothetical protein EHS15_18925 [Leptospira idonii]
MKKISVCLLFLFSFSLSAEDLSIDSLANPNCGHSVVNDKSLIKQRAVWLNNIRWKNGQVIPVYFKNGTKEQRLGVEHCAREWERYGNFKFKFFDEPKRNQDLTILIEFAPQKQGVAGWSYVGSGTKDPSQTSMSFFPEHKGENGCSTIAHEFGHALGLQHEQHNPAKKESWIPEKTYDYFQNQYGWDKLKTDTEILKSIDTYANYGKADPVSIMAYYFPGELFTSGKPMGIRFGLSARDVEGIAKMYPGKKQPNDKRPIFIYYGKGKRELAVWSKNGTFQIQVNGKEVSSLNSSNGRVTADTVNLDDYLNPNQVNTITYTFSGSNKKDFLYQMNVKENGATLFGLLCDPNRWCEGFDKGFHLTHISKGNRGQYSDGWNGSSETEITSPNENVTTTTVATVIDSSLDLPLLDASNRGDTVQVKALLKKGANPNAVYQGWTPLLYASYRGYSSVVLELLKNYANVNAQVSGWTARELAKHQGHTDIVNMIDASMGFHPPEQDVGNRSLPSGLLP